MSDFEITCLSKEYEEPYRLFVQKCPESSLYHTLEWLNVIENTYNYKPHYLIAVKDNKVIGALPLFFVSTLIGGKRLISLPFSHKVNLLYENEEVLKQLLLSAERLKIITKSQYVQFKPANNLDKFTNILELYKSKTFYQTTLSLSTTHDKIWKQFSNSTRRAIRKAERSSMVIHVSDTLDKIDTFYELEVETRKRQGSPPYSFKFFRIFRDKFGGNGMARLYLASQDHHFLAGIIVTYHNNIATYAYGGSINNKLKMQMRPNNLLFWKAIQDAQRLGCKWFDFGTTHSDNAGLLRFKSGWGGETKKIPYYFLLSPSQKAPNQDRNSIVHKIARGMIKRTPKVILRSIGPHLLRQLA